MEEPAVFDRVFNLQTARADLTTCGALASFRKPEVRSPCILSPAGRAAGQDAATECANSARGNKFGSHICCPDNLRN